MRKVIFSFGWPRLAFLPGGRPSRLRVAKGFGFRFGPEETGLGEKLADPDASAGGAAGFAVDSEIRLPSTPLTPLTSL